MRTRITIEVRGWSPSGHSSPVDRWGTDLFVIIAGPIRFPVYEGSAESRVYRDVARMHTLVARTPLKTIVPTVVVPQIIVEVSYSYPLWSTYSTTPGLLACVGNDIIADRRTIATHDDDSASC